MHPEWAGRYSLALLPGKENIAAVVHVKPGAENGESLGTLAEGGGEADGSCVRHSCCHAGLGPIAVMHVKVQDGHLAHTWSPQTMITTTPCWLVSTDCIMSMAAGILSQAHISLQRKMASCQHVLIVAAILSSLILTSHLQQCGT